MPYKILEANRDYHTYTYMVSNEEDLKEIPSNVEGSVAIATETSKVYILDLNKEWKEL